MIGFNRRWRFFFGATLMGGGVEFEYLVSIAGGDSFLGLLIMAIRYYGMFAVSSFNRRWRFFFGATG